MTNADVKKMLAEEAEAAENYDGPVNYVRNRRRPKDPSQVYTLRIPVDRLNELRQLADQRHLAPSVLIRRWVLERLDEEQGTSARRSEFDPDGTDLMVMTREEFREQVIAHVASLVTEMFKIMRDAMNQSSQEQAR